MASTNNQPSVLDLCLFHTLERSLFRRLTSRLAQEPERTKLVLALWLWYESIGHHDFIRHVYSFDDVVIVQFVAEAEACLDRLFSNQDTGGGNNELPCTNSLMTEPITLRFFGYHNNVAYQGVKNILENVCQIIFDDTIMQIAARDVNHPSNRRVMSSGLIIRPFGEGTSLQSANLGALLFGEAAPAITPPAVEVVVGGGQSFTPPVTLPPPAPVVLSGGDVPFGEGTYLQTVNFGAPVFGVAGRAIVPPAVEVVVGGGQSFTPLAPLPPPVPLVQSVLNPMASPWSPVAEQSSEDKRSMFITFSKGYPLSREEIMEFFNSRWGPCVELVMIERAPAGAPPMYGRVIFTSSSMIAVVLNGQRTAKFMINGKHLWARMYVPRQN